MNDVLLVVVVVIALGFDFTNGFHDTANAIATSVGTRAVTPRVAVLVASIANLAGAFVTTAVAKSVATGIIDANLATMQTLLAALTGAIAWNLLTWWLGLPSSSSHALIGGVAGAGVAEGGWSAIVLSGLGKTAVGIVLSPLLGFVLAQLLVVAVQWLNLRATPFAVDRRFRVLQLGSAALYSLGHGGNDAQKTMGIIAVLLYS